MRALFLNPSSSRLLLTSALVFVVLGALQALYGPALPWMMRHFEVDAALAGLSVSAHFGGAFLASLAAGPALLRFGYRISLPLGAGGIAAGAVGVMVAPGFPLLLAGAFLGGLGFGVMTVGMNLRVARAFHAQAAPALNLLNALFGLGAVTAPLMVSLAGGSLLHAMGLVAFAASLAAWWTARLPEPERDAPSPGVRIPWRVAGLFVAMYVAYVSTEIGVGSWETVHLAPIVGERAAALHTSLYWAMLTVGRILVTPLSAVVRPAVLVTGAAALGCAGLALAQWPQAALFAYPLVGLALAPIFPTGIAWLHRVFPKRAEAVASVTLAVAGLGPVVSSGLIGAWVEFAGPQVVPTALFLVSAALLGIVLALRRATRR